jgi:regulator of protease activity HflC (stomatin/prohibitin superfamily)
VTTSAAAGVGAFTATANDATVEMPSVRDELTEHQGKCLPGWPAVLTAVAATGAALWLLWRLGVVPRRIAGHTLLPAPADRGHLAQLHGGTPFGLWGAVMLLAALISVALGGLIRGRPGTVWLLSRCGAYRGTVRRTGLLWINPLFGCRRVDVRLRHWRSRAIDAVDADGTRLTTTVLLVWRVRDTARACFMVDDHVLYLREQVESTVARVLSRLPADDFRGAGPTLRDTDRVGEWLTGELAREMRPVGIQVFSARPVRIEYAPEVAEAMHRHRLAALGARHRQAVLDEAIASVADTVRKLSERGLADLDEYERKALVRELTVAFCTGR